MKKGLEILKRIGYDNDGITATKEWIAKEVYYLALKDAEESRQAAVSGCKHSWRQPEQMNIYACKCIYCGLIQGTGL